MFCQCSICPSFISSTDCKMVQNYQIMNNLDISDYNHGLFHIRIRLMLPHIMQLLSLFSSTFACNCEKIHMQNV